MSSYAQLFAQNYKCPAKNNCDENSTVNNVREAVSFDVPEGPFIQVPEYSEIAYYASFSTTPVETTVANAFTSTGMKIVFNVPGTYLISLNGGVSNVVNSPIDVFFVKNLNTPTQESLGLQTVQANPSGLVAFTRLAKFKAGDTFSVITTSADTEAFATTFFTAELLSYST